MRTGAQGSYRWLVASEFDFCDLLKNCPESVVGKCVVVTSFDSGPFALTEQDQAQGWVKHGKLAIMPQVPDISVLQYDQYDEWYVFSSHVTPDVSTTFVNDGIFELTTPADYVTEAAGLGINSDLVGARYRASIIRERQSLFWEQIRLMAPESYIAQGDNFMLVTADDGFYRRIEGIVRKAVGHPS